MYLCVSLNMINVCTQEREFKSESHSKHPHIQYVCTNSRPNLKLHDLHKYNDGQDTISTISKVFNHRTIDLLGTEERMLCIVTKGKKILCVTQVIIKHVIIKVVLCIINNYTHFTCNLFSPAQTDVE